MGNLARLATIELACICMEHTIWYGGLVLVLIGCNKVGARGRRRRDGNRAEGFGIFPM